MSLKKKIKNRLNENLPVQSLIPILWTMVSEV